MNVFQPWRMIAIFIGIVPLAASAGWFNRVAPEPADIATVVLAQAYLDNLMLGPGKIDGRMGQFTRHSAELFNQLHRQETGNWYRLLRDAKRALSEPFTYYTVRQTDSRYVGSLPTTPAEQEKVSYMSYRSLAEFVAERYHTTQKFLQEINPDKNIYSLRAGATVKVPNVMPFLIESVEKDKRYDEAPALSSRLAYVDTKVKTVKIYNGGDLIANFPVTPGREKFIPYGDWKLDVMVTTPIFRWDKKMLEQGKRGNEFYKLPPGPNSPVGIIWAGLNKSGIGLHGTNSPETIGRSRSAGCIRLSNWDAIRLPGLLRPGAKVLVR